MSCPRCGSADTAPYRYRPPKQPPKDRMLCPWGLPKADHLCVAACADTGTFCRRCRMVT